MKNYSRKVYILDQFYPNWRKTRVISALDDYSPEMRLALAMIRQEVEDYESGRDYDMTEYASREKIKKLYNVTDGYVKRAIKSGLVRTVQPNKRVYIELESFDRYKAAAIKEVKR